MPYYAQTVSSDSLAATATLLVGKAAALLDFHGINTTASLAYIQLFDAVAAANVTVGTTVPRRVLTVPASGSASDTLPAEGLKFDLGIVAASTTTTTGNTGATTHLRIGVA